MYQQHAHNCKQHEWRVFEGEAATAFVSNFESYNAQFTSFGELLESFAQKLDTAANTMEETDGGLAASMGQ